MILRRKFPPAIDMLKVEFSGELESGYFDKTTEVYGNQIIVTLKEVDSEAKTIPEFVSNL